MFVSHRESCQSVVLWRQFEDAWVDGSVLTKIRNISNYFATPIPLWLSLVSQSRHNNIQWNWFNKDRKREEEKDQKWQEEVAAEYRLKRKVWKERVCQLIINVCIPHSVDNMKTEAFMEHIAVVLGSNLIAKKMREGWWGESRKLVGGKQIPMGFVFKIHIFHLALNE